jgi:hypothetical protein
MCDYYINWGNALMVFAFILGTFFGYILWGVKK